MKKGYWVVVYRSIPDEAAVKAYAAAAGPALESLGGRLLTRSTSQVQPHEAGLPQRAVLVEFESYETALAAYEAPLTARRLKRSARVRSVTSESWRARKTRPIRIFFAATNQIVRRRHPLNKRAAAISSR